MATTRSPLSVSIGRMCRRNVFNRLDVMVDWRRALDCGNVKLLQSPKRMSVFAATRNDSVQSGLLWVAPVVFNIDNGRS